MELWRLPEDPILRLRHYQREREAMEKEKRLVEAALAVPEAERTKAEQSAIGYSRFGTAARTCH